LKGSRHLPDGGALARRANRFVRPIRKSTVSRENFPLSPTGKSPLWLVASRAFQEGRIAIVTKRWREMRWMFSMGQTSASEADGKAVWS
jgi:hypothetical protein